MRSYSQKENQITENIAIALRELSVNTINYIFQQIIDDPSINPIKIETQVKNVSSGTIPDMEIGSCTKIVVEAKVSPIRKLTEDLCKQLKGHLDGYNDCCNVRLLLITSDECNPLESPDNKCQIDDRWYWISFDLLINLFESLLGCYTSINDYNFFLSEKERYELYKLVQFLKSFSDLFPSRKDKVMIIGGRSAYPFYKKCNAYICQASRNFQPSEFLGFYLDKEVKPEFPRIMASIESIDLNKKINKADFDNGILQYAILDSSFGIEDVVAELKAIQKCIISRALFSHFLGVRKVLLLGLEKDLISCSSIRDRSKFGFKRSKSIPNNKVSSTGVSVPYTYGHARYTTVSKVCSAKKTSDL